MSDSPVYSVLVHAEAFYLPEQSDEVADRYAFAYRITITNTGTAAAQLLSRHWVIKDMEDRIQEVQGDGVVGEQPVLEPGQHFEYMSSASIATPIGSMQGNYRMQSADGKQFDAEIPSFVLAMPRTLH